MVSLAEDVKHAQTYAEIQRMRFSKRLQIDFPDCPEANASLLVPRLILQPILENAFEHGVGKRPQAGKIQVTYLDRGNRLMIRVADNGQDLSDEQIKRIQAALEETSEMIEITGMRNIHRRLRLVYGQESGLTIERSEMGGLSVTLTIHYLKEDV